MGQMRGLGVTHSPPLLSASGDTAWRIKRPPLSRAGASQSTEGRNSHVQPIQTTRADQS
jgi:hypothetical protein